MCDEVAVEREIAIAASQQQVFSFVSDYANDPQWRVGARQVEYSHPLEVGTLVTDRLDVEGTRLEFRMKVVELDFPRVARAELMSDAGYHLVDVRTVTATGEGTSRFRYRVEFDREILRSAVPRLPPADQVTAWSDGMLRSSLENISKILAHG
jgi:hypothetical protein